MTDILTEITKHLSFRMKIIAILCCHRCHKYIRIYDVPERVQMEWNDDRIILFPDIRALQFRFAVRNNKVVLQFDPAIIAKMKLVSFKFIDFKEFHSWGAKDIDFQFLKGMQTLKQLYFYTGDSYEYIRIDDILKTLDLHYLDNEYYIAASDPIIHFSHDSLKHMKLRAYNYMTDISFEGMCARRIGEIMPSFRYLDTENLDDKVIGNIADCCLHTLKLCYYGNSDYEWLNLIAKLHKLIIYIFTDLIDYSFLKDMKLYELHIHQTGMHSGNIPPIEYIIANGIKKLRIYGSAHYSDEDLKRLDSDVFVKQTFLLDKN